MDKVLITSEAYTKLCQYILGTDLEISGMGYVEMINGVPLITQIKIFEQEVSAGTTELDIDSLSKFLLEEDEAGVIVSNYKVWWHSHNTMSAFFSGTDTATIKELGSTFDWLIAIVGNHDMEFKVNVSVNTPFFAETEMPLVVTGSVDESQEIKAEIEEKVTEKVYYTPPPKKVGSGFLQSPYKNERHQYDYHGDEEARQGTYVDDDLPIIGEDPVPLVLSNKLKKRANRILNKGTKYMESLYGDGETFCNFKKCAGAVSCGECMDIEEYVINELATRSKA